MSMRTDFDRAYVTAHGSVAVLTLNHPEAMNAAGTKLVRGAAAALNFVEKKENGFRAMILTGEGRGFCSGANLAERGSEETGGGHALETVYHPFLRRLRDLSIPFVTAVNGAAAGVGMSIAPMGDLGIARSSTWNAPARNAPERQKISWKASAPFCKSARPSSKGNSQSVRPRSRVRDLITVANC